MDPKFTENFVASGGIHNFTGNESFTSQSFAYGSGSLSNTVTFSRVETAGGIYVDTSNESGAFRSFDAPGSSKYLFLPVSPTADVDGAIDLRISFSKSINAFAFRIGDLFDSDGNAKWLYVVAEDASNPNPASFRELISVATYTSSPLTVDGNTITTGNGVWSYFGWTFDVPVRQIRLHSGIYGGTDNIGIDTISFVTVPEPSTYAMALAGLACGGVSMWRRRKRA